MSRSKIVCSLALLALIGAARPSAAMTAEERRQYLEKLQSLRLRRLSHSQNLRPGTSHNLLLKCFNPLEKPVSTDRLKRFLSIGGANTKQSSKKGQFWGAARIVF